MKNRPLLTPKTPRRLLVRRETLRTLAPRQLSGVAAGEDITTLIELITTIKTSQPVDLK